MCPSTLEEVESLLETVDTVVVMTILCDPSLVNDAQDDDGTFPDWAARRIRSQIYKLLSFSSTDEEVDASIYEIAEDLIAGSIYLVEALRRWQLLSLPPAFNQFVVRWQAMLNLYLLSRAGVISTLAE